MRLPDPSTPAGASGLAAILAEPAQAVVALDFDGTLAPIVERPEDARAHPDAIGALGRLADAVGEVAIITGRPALRAVEYGGLAGAPGLHRLVVLGHYGLERWDADTGALTAPELPVGLAAARERLPEVLAAAGAPDGTNVEDKHSALAVHVRQTADPAAAMARLRGPLADLAAGTGLALEPGRMVLELRPPGYDKGGALRTLVAERGARAVLFAGDDLGDLAAYDAVDALRAEGVPGIKVCSGSDEVAELQERADLVVDGPAGVIALLDALAAAIGSGG